MPQIIVIADGEHGRAEGTVTLRERINATDFESHTFGQRLIERLGWAVGDAHEAERIDPRDTAGRDADDTAGRDADDAAERDADDPEEPGSGGAAPEGRQPRASASVVTTAS